MKRNGFLIFITSILVAWAVYSSSQLKLIEDVSETLPQSEELNDYKALYNRTGITGSILVAFEVNEDESHLDAADQLASILALDSSGLIEDIRLDMDGREPKALLEHFSKYFWIYADESDLDSLNSDAFIRNRLSLTMDKLRGLSGMAMKQFLMADPLQLVVPRLSSLEKLKGQSQLTIIDGYLHTGDGRYMILLIEPTHPPSESEKNSALVASIRSHLAQIEEANGISGTMVFGGPVIAVENADRIRADIKVVATLSIVFILLLLVVVFRNPLTPLLFILPPSIGFVMGLGTYSLLIGRISALALGVSTIMLGIAIDYSFHFFNHFKHNGSVSKTIKEIRSPLILGCATTVLAFFGLRFLNSGILREFGLLAGLILIFCAFSVLIFLPALIRLTRFKIKDTKPLFGGMTMPPAIKKWSLPVFLGLTVFLFFFASDAKFEDDLNKINYFPEHLQIAQDRISGPTDNEQVYVLLEGSKADAVERGKHLAASLDALQATGVNLHYASVSSILEDANSVENSVRLWRERSPEFRDGLISRMENIGAEFGFKKSFFDNYREALNSDPDQLYNDAFASPVIEDLVLGSDSTFSLIVPITVKKEDRTKIEAAIISAGEKPVVVSSLAAALVESVNEDLNMILMLTSGLVLITLLLTYGRFELAILTFVPMVLSWVWILGFCGLFDIRFNMVNVVVTTIIFGLGDDYSIFITDGILSRHRDGIDKLKSYRGAIILSALTTIVGTGVLIFAGHPALKSIAILSVVGMLSVLIASLVVQPFLFKVLIENRTVQGKPPLTLIDLLITLRDFGWFFIGCVGLIMSLPFFKLFPAKDAAKRKVFNKMLSPLMRSVISINGHVTRAWENEELAQLEKPCVIVANHTSFIDILAISGYDSRVLILTNEWVWNSPFFGWIIRYAEYIRAKNNGDLNMEMIRRKVAEGYSVLVFPEGTRSSNGKIGRFKKGAFKLAEDLNLDVLPLVLHGYHRVLNKGDYVVNISHLNGRFLPRIKPDDTTFGENYSQRAKQIGRYFREEFNKDVIRLETVHFHSEWVRRCYTYKGPVLEWYVRIKLKLENNFEDIVAHIPRSAKVYDLGCGYGYLSFMLAFTSENRNVIGVDYDDEKVEVAQHSFYQGGNVSFLQGDLSTFEPEQADVFIIKDVLHYMTPEDQDALLERCGKQLNPGGTILIRDGIAEDRKGQKVTAWTEVMSTQVFGFNKTKNDLHFLSEAKINDFAARFGLSVKMIRNESSSNHIFVLTA